MTGRRSKLLLVGYFLLTAPSVVYAHSFSRSGPAVFATFVGLWSVLVLVAVFGLSSRSRIVVGLLVISTVVLLLRDLLRLYPSVLVGPDIYVGVVYLRQALTSGWQIGGGPPAILYPGFWISGAIFSRVLGLSPWAAASSFGAVVSLVVLVFLFLIGRDRYSAPAGLLAAVLFGLTFKFIYFHGSFVKEALGLPLALIVIWATMQLIEDGRDTRFSAIAVLTGLILVSVHHLTTFLAVAVLGLLSLAYFIWSPFDQAARQRGKEMFTMCLLLGTVAGSFWIYVESSPIFLAIRELLRVSFESTPTPPSSVSGPTINLGGVWGTIRSISEANSFILGPLTGLLSLIYFIRRPRPDTAGFLAFGGMMAVLAILLTQLVSSLGSGTVWGGRFEVFGSLFLSLLVAALLVEMSDTQRRKVAAGLFVVAIIVVQAFVIPPSFYTHTDQPRNLDGAKYYTLPSEQAAVDWSFNTSSEAAIEAPLAVNLIDYYTLGRPAEHRLLGSPCDAAESNVIHSKSLGEPAWCSIQRNTIYDSGSAGVMTR